MSIEYLNDAWNRKADDEHGEDTEESVEKNRFSSEYFDNVNIYEKIKTINESVAKNARLNKDLKESLNDFFADVQEGLINYVNAIYRTKSLGLRSKTEKEDVNEKYVADQDRRLAHNALIAKLQILARVYGKAGLDNSWASDVGLETEKQALNRHKVQTWAESVVHYIASSK